MKKWLLVFALLLPGVCLVQGAFLVQPASAQTETTESADPESREAGFRSVTGPEVEQVPGGALLLGAYGFAWIATLLFFGRVHRMSSATASELDRLRKTVESLESR